MVCASAPRMRKHQTPSSVVCALPSAEISQSAPPFRKSQLQRVDDNERSPSPEGPFDAQRAKAELALVLKGQISPIEAAAERAIHRLTLNGISPRQDSAAKLTRPPHLVRSKKRFHVPDTNNGSSFQRRCENTVQSKAFA